MKNKILGLFIMLFWLVSGVQAQLDSQVAMEVIERFTEGKHPPIQLHLKAEEGKEWFETEVKDKTLHITGSSNVALCRGFYDYVKAHGWGIFCWNGSRCELPQAWPVEGKNKVTSVVPYHYYMNVCTFGYTTPYWDWERWQKEIDWMALHGINMPLALVGNEAISARLWKKYGLTDEEINNYFAGPAHLPWMRMGNISHHDGPLTDNWHRQQIALQHRILAYMRELGMHPICPAFAGFVPKSITRVCPNVKITETVWGKRFRNWMLNPESPLFYEMGKRFIQEWEKEFGKCYFYLADSFNEMEIPFPPIGTKERYEMLRLYGDRLYQSIREGNEEAVWVMQGWMFGYDRKIWEPKTLEALLEKVPDDKIILLDLAANYNKYEWKNECNWDYYKGFFNTTWIYSVIPNMGGKNTFSGCLDFFANNRLEALHSPNRGQLCGYGMAPEGVESNEMVFELITDAEWKNTRTDVTDWLRKYSLNRYGYSDCTLDSIWSEMCHSIYAKYVSHPRFNWVYRPGTVRKGSVNVNSHLYQAVEMMLEWSKDKEMNALHQSDMIEWVMLYAGQKMEDLVNQVQDALFENRVDDAKRLFAHFKTLGLKLDKLLTSHPCHRAELWVERARKAGVTLAERSHYEKNAKRIITVWGPPVDDYSSRVWSGVIRDYYIPRWEKWMEMRLNNLYPDLAEWEVNWVENSKGFSHITSYPNVLTGANEVVACARKVQETTGSQVNVLGEWHVASEKLIPRHLTYNIEQNRLKSMKGLHFVSVPGSSDLIVEKIQVRMDGKVVKEVKFEGKKQQNMQKVKIQVPHDASGNNGCDIKIFTKIKGQTTGRVLIF